MLDSWEDTLPKFVKVMPTDYARALQALAEEETPVLEAAE